MSAFSSYLSHPKTKKVLSRKPGDEGFSLIELVVVVAVLAILAAIAIPAFTSINDKAAVAAAQNTLGQIVKECAVKKANGEDETFNIPNLNSYKLDSAVDGAKGDCAGTLSKIILGTKPGANAKLPTSISINVDTGAKECTKGASDADSVFCKSSAW